MKRIFAASAFVAGMVLASSAFATDTWIALGQAPSSDGGGTSFAVGFKGKSRFGFEVGGIGNAQYSSYVLDYPVPHSDYKKLGVQRVQDSFGIDALYFFGDDVGLRAYAGLGGYYSKRQELAKSNATGWVYNQGDQSSFVAGAQLGVQYVAESGVNFGASLHSVRGPSLSAGWRF